MEIQSYNAELALANLMFMRIFNNIRIDRTNSKNEQKVLKVNCVFGQRSRIQKNFENAERRATLKFPMIAINRTGYARNPDRLNNMHNEVKYEVSGKNRNYNMLTPIPIDISYDVSVISKTPSDIDQIASNFMVFFNSDIYVSCVHPKYQGIKLNNQIIMSDSISEEHLDELDESAGDLITTTFQFTFKTYLFGGSTQYKPKPKYVLSSTLSTYNKTQISSLEYEMISTYYDLNPESDFYVKVDQKVRYRDLSDYHELNPEIVFYAKTSKPVTEEVSVYVPTPASSYIYDGIVPIIDKLDVGFYAIDQLCADYYAAMNSIDNMETPALFRDSMHWSIDDNSTNEFPYNVKY